MFNGAAMQKPSDLENIFSSVSLFHLLNKALLLFLIQKQFINSLSLFLLGTHTHIDG